MKLTLSVIKADIGSINLAGASRCAMPAQRRSDVDPLRNSAMQMDETRQEEEHVSSPA